MKKLAIFLVLAVFSLNVNAREIGGDENSGYENMSCKQMIEANLKYQATSKLNENAINAELLLCSKPFFKSDRKYCVKEIEVREKKYRDMMNAFVNALGIRVQIYDSLNIADKSKLSPECRNITEKSYKREAQMSDNDFFRKLYLKCKIRTDVAMNSRIKISDLYGNNVKQYADREICMSYLYEYSKKMYGDPIRQDTVETKIKAAESVSAERQSCQKLTCDVIMKNPTNNPSPCYRNAVIDCMTNGVVSGNGFGSPGVGGTGR